jgi:hypothetical protein
LDEEAKVRVQDIHKQLQEANMVKYPGAVTPPLERNGSILVGVSDTFTVDKPGVVFKATIHVDEGTLMKAWGRPWIRHGLVLKHMEILSDSGEDWPEDDGYA